MADFTSEFWNYYVALISLVSMAGCGVFLWLQSRKRVLCWLVLGCATQSATLSLQRISSLNLYLYLVC